MKKRSGATFLALVTTFIGPMFGEPSESNRRIWEKSEIVLYAERSYDNAYTQVVVWADVHGPDFKKRCYGFWDGGNVYRIRILATAPGLWKWITGSNQDDPGLNGKVGWFRATEWSQDEMRENSCRRGMIRASANGHAFEYADGTPFFLLGDTWWSAGTFRYPWFDEDIERSIGPQAGFKDYVKFRKEQGFNCIAMIAAFPNWANDDKPPDFHAENGIELRSAWPQAGTKSGKAMHDEKGNRVFLFPGKIPGHENDFPDVDRLNPAYFENLDKKIDHLNAQGFIPFIEVCRRDVGPAWHQYYSWPDSYARFVQYVWARYQANICLFSPIHYDYDQSLAAEHWNAAANAVIDRYGRPPFGTLVSSNPFGSSLHSFDHRADAKWITFHQIGNSHRHDSYAWQTEIFNAAPPLPSINGEPVYAGMYGAPGDSENASLYCRSHMYGSLLSGGLGGHIYGAGDKAPAGGAMWAGEVENVDKPHIWDAIKWPSGDQVRHLKTFVTSKGRIYSLLEPHVELLDPYKSEVGNYQGWDGCVGWAYCSRTPQKNLFLLYFEKLCRRAILEGAKPDSSYVARWFDPRSGIWTDGELVLKADRQGRILLPEFPGGLAQSNTDWALQLTLLSE